MELETAESSRIINHIIGIVAAFLPNRGLYSFLGSFSFVINQTDAVTEYLMLTLSAVIDVGIGTTVESVSIYSHSRFLFSFLIQCEVIMFATITMGAAVWARPHAG